MLKDLNLDIESLYKKVPKVAEAPVDPMGRSTSRGKIKLNIAYKNGNTYITGDTYLSRPTGK